MLERCSHVYAASRARQRPRTGRMPVIQRANGLTRRQLKRELFRKPEPRGKNKEK